MWEARLSICSPNSPFRTFPPKWRLKVGFEILLSFTTTVETLRSCAAPLHSFVRICLCSGNIVSFSHPEKSTDLYRIRKSQRCDFGASDVKCWETKWKRSEVSFRLSSYCNVVLFCAWVCECEWVCLLL
jgi:hypothetical protein